MNKKIVKLCILGFIIVSIAGTLLHFIYDWSGNNRLIGMFAPVNESPWEHLKLLFLPFFAYTFYVKRKLKNDKFNVFFASYISIIIGMISSIVYYYTLNGIIGGNNTWVNLSSYFIGVAIAFVLFYFVLVNSIGNGILNGIGFAMLIITLLVFILFTFEPPILPLFQDPQNSSYGI